MTFSNIPPESGTDDSVPSRKSPDGAPKYSRGNRPDVGLPPFEGVRIKELLGVPRRHALLILAITALTVAPAAYLALTQSLVYVASALIRLADTRRPIVGAIAEETETRPVGRFTDPILSQIQLLQSVAVYEQVVDREGLRLARLSEAFPRRMLSDVAVAPDATADSLWLRFSDAAYTVRTQSAEIEAAYRIPVEIGGVTFSVDSVPPVDTTTLVVLPREVAVALVMGGVQAVPRERTDLVDITYTSSDPERAQRVVNALVTAFQDYIADLAQQQSRRRRVFLETQLQTTDSLLRQAQSELALFRSQHQVYRSEDRFAAQQKSLMDLDIRRSELDAERQIYQSLLATLGSPAGRNQAGTVQALVSSPGMTANPVISQLYRQLVDYESRRNSLTAGPGGSTAADPEVRRLEALISETVGELVNAVHSVVVLLDARIAALDGLRTRTAAAIHPLPAAQAEEERLTERVRNISQVANRLRTLLQEARMAEAIEVGEVEIVSLAPSAVPVSGRTGKKVVLAIMLGLMLGCGCAFAAEALNTSIRRYRDIPTMLELPQLAVIPMVASMNGAGEKERRRLRLSRIFYGRNGSKPSHVDSKGDRPSTVTVQSTAVEAFRTLRTNLIFSPSFDAVTSVVITSPSPEEGKTTVAAHLAVVFAQQGIRVLLIDSDLRRPRLHRMFGMAQEPGLSGLLDARYSLAEAIRQTGVKGLSLLPSGTLVPNPAELLSGEPMHRLLRSLSKHFNLLIIDTPPVLSASEASSVAARADRVLLVVRAGKTEQGAAEQGLEQLAAVGARVMGAILNDPDGQVPRFRDYHYRYDYYAATPGDRK